ncbi:calcium-binding protein [Tychonema sp. LEGE 07199]|uniref:calcium-binding protein n=1 Tax=unclassified Tychonema TaxID=2642144 RepID=UPI00187F2553|nr:MULTISPECIES: calcium-binding protein [unclassified Tychonema]MBE9123844.1 calcium-binding protein [Tychonema sp. LEGE 07199]MBE9131266.1 calcium-binding protein [Tychonema sp. LEGE 07196]
MANYAIFDEKYYLSQYPWVKPAIDTGVVKSGQEHFEKYGLAGGLTKVSRYFDEATYLAGNPDIAALVRTPNNPNAPFATGLDHFIQYGYEEGRTRVSPEYDEAFYIANNRQLQPFIQNGTFKNGYQHFIQFGIKDGQFGTSFFETEYLGKNPDVRPFVESGALKTGREHYFNFGKSDPSRSATFIGSSGNDMIAGAGVGNTELIGVEVGLGFSIPGRNYESDGSNEFDTLTGGSGRDKFVLGDVIQGTGGKGYSSPTKLYIGPGFATIRNFTQGQDSIQLATGDIQPSLDNFLIVPINNNRDLAIQTNGLFVSRPDGSSEISRFDTIAVIEGGGNLKLNLLPESRANLPLLG